MKSTGIVRKVDELGRIVLPKELRTVLHINERDPLEIYVEGKYIMLQKYEPSCVFCGSSDNVVPFREKNVCRKCVEELGRDNNRAASDDDDINESGSRGGRHSSARR